MMRVGLCVIVAVTVRAKVRVEIMHGIIVQWNTGYLKCGFLTLSNLTPTGTLTLVNLLKIQHEGHKNSKIVKSNLGKNLHSACV